MSNSTDILLSTHLTHISTKKTQLRFIKLLLPELKAIFVAFIFLSISITLTLSAPFVIKYFIDFYITNNYYPLIECILFALLVLSLDTFSSIFRYFQGIKFQVLSLNIVYNLRTQLFSHILKYPIKTFDTNPVGGFVSRVTNDTENITLLVTNVLPAFIEGILMSVGIFIALAILDLHLALITSLFILPLFLGIFSFQKLSKPYVEKAQATLSEINGKLNEYIQGMFLIQTLQKTTFFINQFSIKNTDYENFRNKTVLFNGLFLRSFGQLIMQACLAACLFYFFFKYDKDVSYIGLIFVFVNYLERLFEPLLNISMQLNQWQQSLISAGRIFAYLDEPTDQTFDINKTTLGAQNQSDNKQIHPNGTALEFNHVSLSYDNGHSFALKDVSFMVKEGEFIGIVGHTGSGKSSIVNVLMGLYPITQGSITLLGFPIENYSEESLRKRVGLVLQEPYLFSDSILKNICLEMSNINDALLQQVLSQSRAELCVNRLPGGLKYILGERGNELSTGEKQLIAFARTLLHSPQLLILDEATASIDAELEEAIKTAIVSARKGRTTLAIAHRLSSIQDADRILVLDKGKMVGFGTHMDLMNSCAQYYKLYQSQYNQSK